MRTFRIVIEVHVNLLYCDSSAREKKIEKQWVRVLPYLPSKKRCRQFFLCSVDCASLYNLVNETNLLHAFILSVFHQFYL